jgi:hypothetical protein
MSFMDGMKELLYDLKTICRANVGYSEAPKNLKRNKVYYDTVYLRNIKVGVSSWSHPQFIEGLTCQCKNCEMHQERGHCMVTSEKHTPESWCSTADPKMFFKPKRKE